MTVFRRFQDPFYGHEETAKLCARFITHLFACPDVSPTSSMVPLPALSPPLANFIAYALYRTRLHPCVTFAALYILQRLKARFPAARGSSGHRLFIAAFMLTSKIICDDIYSNKSWSIVGHGMFALREINQMEREMCSYLEWQLSIEPDALKEFEAKVRRDFKGLGPYPTYVLPSPAPTPMPSTSPYNSQVGGGAPIPTPSFAASSQRPPPASPQKPLPPPVSVHAGPPPTFESSSPGVPNTPDSWMPSSSSPVTSAGVEGHSAQVAGSDTPMEVDSGPSTTASHAPGKTATARAPSARVRSYMEVRPGEIYAFAYPCVW